jgi:TfuA protein
VADHAVIFLGPSLPPPRPAIAGVEYRAPAARGDLVAAARSGAGIVGLIDGVFHHQLAVTPREVREAAALGAQLFGGASIGALRACECPEAMTGVGEIHARFARGELTDDDEVAVTFDPATYRLAAYPLVQIRELARLLAERHPDAAGPLTAYVEQVRALAFADRVRGRLRALAGDLARAGVAWAEIEALLDDARTDVKRRDAGAVIDAVRAALGGTRSRA